MPSGQPLWPVVGSRQAVTSAGLARRPLWPPLSLTLHPPDSSAFASRASMAHFRVPINSFVCVFFQIDSRPRSHPRHLSTSNPKWNMASSPRSARWCVLFLRAPPAACVRAGRSWARVPGRRMCRDGSAYPREKQQRANERPPHTFRPASLRSLLLVAEGSLSFVFSPCLAWYRARKQEM